MGKTEVAKVLASSLDTDLIRLQCYEGLDVNHSGLRVELRPAAAGNQALGGQRRPGQGDGVKRAVQRTVPY